VTHEEDIAERADRIITLEDGEIVSDYSNTDVGNVFSSALGGQKV